MLYNKHNLAVAKIASKDSYREEVKGVLFTKTKTVATDTYRLLEVTTPDNLQAADYPVTAMIGVKPFIVDAKRLLQGVKLITNPLAPMFETMALSHVDDNKVTVLYHKNKESAADPVTLPRVAGTFPDYGQLFPAGTPVIEVAFNGQYLAELLAIMGKLSPLATVTMKLYGKEKPIVLEASNQHQKSRGLLMPVRE